MKLLRYTILAVLAAIGFSSAANAQTGRITTKVTTGANAHLSEGRDFWFTSCEPYLDNGKNSNVELIYVSSTKAATVNIAITGSAAQQFQVKANQVETFTVPLAWQVETSAIVENKAIHLWSDDADLSVYMLDYIPYISEGMMILPTIGWDTSYTVAAYAGLFESTFDYPSEFAVIANQNGTSTTITPWCDIRQNGSAQKVAYPKLQAFVQTLNQGQCVQYLSILAQNCEDYDFTGTLVVSNVPVGIVGASQCPNIPCDYPYCDFVTEMNIPRRMWDTQYLTMPTTGRGQNNSDTFLVIGSVNGQMVYIDDPQQGQGIVFCQVNNNQYYWFDAVQNPERFWSQQPFELLQYENSSTWDNTSIGDGSMTTIPGISQYSSRVAFQTPVTTGLQYGFANYVNIMCPAGTGATTTLDGVPLAKFPGVTKVRFYSNQFEGYLVSKLDSGAHVLQCDTSNPANVVGAYLYGYGNYDSYMWPAGFGNSESIPADTFPPIVSTSGQCACATISVSDFVHPADSKIMAMNLDSSSNMIYTPDPSYLPGTFMSTTHYNLCVADPSKPAYAKVNVYDYAGNYSTIASSYVPSAKSVEALTIEPETLNFGVLLQGGARDSIILKNNSDSAFDLTSVSLTNSSSGFTILETVPSGIIPRGDSVKVYIGFSPSTLGNNYDTLVIADSCFTQLGYLLGIRGHPDFILSTTPFGCVPVGTSIRSDTNVSMEAIFPTLPEIDSVWVDDTAEFHFAGNLPIHFLLNITEHVPFRFTPDSINPHIATLTHFEDKKDSIIHTDSLFGCGSAPTTSVAESSRANSDALGDWMSGKNSADILLLPAHPNPVLTTTSDVVITIGLRRSGAATLKLFDLSGKEVSTLLDARSQARGFSDIHFNPGSLPSGTYLYQLDALGSSLSGRLVIAW